MTRQQYQTYIEWLLVGFVGVSVATVWYQTRLAGQTGDVSVYDIFPLFGLLAFGLMWTHFISGATRRAFGLKPHRSVYWKLSSGLVLTLIIAHPLFLNIGLVNDGLGLPPGSYEQVYGALTPWLMVGTVSLLVFLSFELHRWYREKNWWKYIEWAQVIAMTAIFFHALMLGRELTTTWFLVVWWMMGVTLLVSVVYTRYNDSVKR